MNATTSPIPEGVWPSALVKGDLARAKREWIHTNGAGAYASSTLAGTHTRRYHGLLVAALDPPRARHVLLSHVDITVAPQREPGSSLAPSARGAPATRWDLAKHQFPGVDPTAGAFYLERFDQDPLPRWTYALPAGELEVTLALVRGENATVLRYRWRGKKPIQLTLRPLLAARGAHLLQREHGGMLQRVELRALPGEHGAHGVGEVRVQPRKDLPRICFRYEGTFVGSPDWWRRFEYLRERDRGLDYVEDLWTPGVFELPLGDAPSYLLAAVDRLLAKEQTLGANLKFEDIIEEVAGVYPRIMQQGDMEAGAWSCGMVAGLIHDIPSVKELIDRIMAEADGIIRQRLAGMAGA